MDATPTAATRTTETSPRKETTVTQVPPTMTAVVQRRYGTSARDVLAVEAVPVPTPGEGEVLVQVHAAGVDRGVWHLMTGKPAVARLMFGVRRPKQPIPGMDLAGTIVAVGEGVTGFDVGDEVFGVGTGAYAQYAVAPAAKLARRPAALTAEAAASVPISGMTALQAVRREAAVHAGERVLVLGASGGVGTFAVQIARAAGAHVTGVASTSKLDLVRALGADEVVDHTTTDVTAGEARFDVVIDIGGNTSLRRLRRVLVPHGRLVIVGGENGGWLVGGVDRQIRARLLSPFVSQTLGFFLSDEDGGDVEVLAGLIVSGQVEPVVDRVRPLSEAADAIEDLAAGLVRGKAVIAV